MNALRALVREVKRQERKVQRLKRKARRRGIRAREAGQRAAAVEEENQRRADTIEAIGEAMDAHSAAEAAEAVGQLLDVHRMEEAGAAMRRGSVLPDDGARGAHPGRKPLRDMDKAQSPEAARYEQGPGPAHRAPGSKPLRDMDRRHNEDGAPAWRKNTEPGSGQRSGTR